MSDDGLSQLALPAPLAIGGYSLRCATPADQETLDWLYCSIRWREFEATHWPDALKAAFLKSQAALQRQYYSNTYSGAEMIVLENNRSLVGRLCLSRGVENYHIVDLSILPETQNQGLGGALLAAVIMEAQKLGKTVSLQVARFNRAQRLYRRMGFQDTGAGGPSLFMEWRPQPGRRDPGPPESVIHL